MNRPVGLCLITKIIGRGTRLFAGKDYFTIYDFVKAYHHFNDPAWDGEPPEAEPAVAQPVRQPCALRFTPPVGAFNLLHNMAHFGYRTLPGNWLHIIRKQALQYSPGCITLHYVILFISVVLSTPAANICARLACPGCGFVILFEPTLQDPWYKKIRQTLAHKLLLIAVKRLLSRHRGRHSCSLFIRASFRSSDVSPLATVPAGVRHGLTSHKKMAVLNSVKPYS